MVSLMNVALVAAWIAPSAASAQMVIVVRHAERADAGAPATWDLGNRVVSSAPKPQAVLTAGR